MTGYPESVFVGGPSFTVGRGVHTPRIICLHGSASPQQDIDWWAARAATRGGTHYMVGRTRYNIKPMNSSALVNTQVIQFVDEANTAWGNGFPSMSNPPVGCSPFLRGYDPNEISFSIEMCKNDPFNTDSLTSTQMAEVMNLCLYLSKAYNIPPMFANDVMTGGYIGHFNVDPEHRWFCPGPFNWGQLFTFVQENL